MIVVSLIKTSYGNQASQAWAVDLVSQDREAGYKNTKSINQI